MGTVRGVLSTDKSALLFAQESTDVMGLGGMRYFVSGPGASMSVACMQYMSTCVDRNQFHIRNLRGTTLPFWVSYDARKVALVG